MDHNYPMACIQTYITTNRHFHQERRATFIRYVSAMSCGVLCVDGGV